MAKEPTPPTEAEVRERLAGYRPLPTRLSEAQKESLRQLSLAYEGQEVDGDLLAKYAAEHYQRHYERRLAKGRVTKRPEN